jgi:hypothetical protein
MVRRTTVNQHQAIAQLFKKNAVLKGRLFSYTIVQGLHRGVDEGATAIYLAKETPHIVALLGDLPSVLRLE